MYIDFKHVTGKYLRERNWRWALWDDGDDGDTSVTSNDRAVHLLHVKTFGLCDECVGPHDIKCRYSENSVGVVSTNLFVYFTSNGNCRIDLEWKINEDLSKLFEYEYKLSWWSEPIWCHLLSWYCTGDSFQEERYIFNHPLVFVSTKYRYYQQNLHSWAVSALTLSQL